MKKIGLFCSASDGIDPLYGEKAEELGRWLGEHHKWLIYGGSDCGLMAAVADAAKAAGAMLMGVVPTKIEERGLASDKLDVIFHAVNLSDRKDIMLQESDVLVALPGGVGTLDEVFHVVASASIGYHDKQVILYNIDHFWDGLIDFLEQLDRQRFIHKRLKKLIRTADTFDQLTAMLQEDNN